MKYRGWSHRIWLVIATVQLIAILVAGPAWAGAPEAKSDAVAVRLFSAVSGTGDLTTVPAGLEVSLDGDWKTYWRSPGDAGLPPSFDWSGSSNLAAAQLSYPAPQRITVLGIQTFGYKHRVVFPLGLKVAHAGQPLDLKLKLDLLVCATQCVPKSFDLALSIPGGAPEPTVDAQALAQARAAVPADSRTSGLSVEKVEEVADRGAQALQVAFRSIEPLRDPDVIAEAQPDVPFGTPRLHLADGGRSGVFVVPLARPLPHGSHLAGHDVTLTLTDAGRALETRAPVSRGTSAAAEDRGPSLLAMLGIALLGGLILNLMPCVLPVLSLKFISVVSQGGRASGAVRASFLATAAGIVASFLVIAGALLAIKAAGGVIGWGLQFQQPIFIMGMAVLTTLFASQLAGLFEILLPRFIAGVAETRSGPDQHLAGHFVTGAFATLLATPCSAPFLGTAVGFALAGDTTTLLGIFFALGIGLALPYLVIAVWPQLATYLPRPGRWMLFLRRAMAIPLAATAVWLLAILANQTRPALALIAALLLIAIVALLAIRTRLPAASRRIAAPAIMLLAAAAILLPDVVASRMAAQGHDDTIAWTGFDRAKIRSLVSQGKTIFVDVTADWCLTCKANKRFVLSQAEIAQRLNTRAIAMQADWTRPDPAIGAYLASYGRYGIPFNIVYGPGAPAGIVLPELLTPGEVLSALDKASRLNS